MDQNEESQKQNVQQQPKPEEHKTEQPGKPGMITKLREKLSNYRRVISVSRKPDKEEFVSAAKVTGLGILFIGLIGFVIFMAYRLVAGGA